MAQTDYSDNRTGPGIGNDHLENCLFNVRITEVDNSMLRRSTVRTADPTRWLPKFVALRQNTCRRVAGCEGLAFGGVGDDEGGSFDFGHHPSEGVLVGVIPRMLSLAFSLENLLRVHWSLRRVPSHRFA